MKISYRALLLAFVILLHVSFYISAISTKTYDYFFPWGNVHEWQGIDFFCVPNGAYAYLRGGSLTGELKDQPTYTYANINVYHPFFTIVFGSFFQLFQPKTAMLIWHGIKGLITIVIFLVFYRKYKHNKYFYLSSFIYFSLFPQYLEIWNGQYQFLVTLGLFLLFFSSKKHTDTFSNGFYYFFTLLVKPIGLLWIPAFLVHKQWKILLTGIFLYICFTALFLIDSSGLYFVTNLLERIQHPIGGPPGIFTIESLLRFYFPLSLVSVLMKYMFLGILLGFQLKWKPSLLQSLFIWTAYYMLFYDLVFEYHYTSLIPFFMFGLVTKELFQKKRDQILLLTYSFPTPFFLFHYFQVFAHGHYVTDTGWTILVLTRTIPLFLLVVFFIIDTIFNKKQVHVGEEKKVKKN